MNQTARQDTPNPTSPQRRRVDRQAPAEPPLPVYHENIRFAIVKNGTDWLIEYRDGVPFFGAPIGAALFRDEKEARSLARELGAYTVTVLLKSEAGQ